jgi:hypothetical protein
MTNRAFPKLNYVKKYNPLLVVLLLVAILFFVNQYVTTKRQRDAHKVIEECLYQWGLGNYNNIPEYLTEPKDTSKKDLFEHYVIKNHSDLMILAPVKTAEGVLKVSAQMNVSYDFESQSHGALLFLDLCKINNQWKIDPKSIRFQKN